MYISQLKNLNRLSTIRLKLIGALEEIDVLLEEVEGSMDSGGMPEHDLVLGYAMHLSLWPDGSGRNVSLDGCYLGMEILEAARSLTIARLQKIEDIMFKEYGVECDA